MANIKVYGADWCGLTTRTLSHLEDLGLPFDYINVEEDPAASEWVKQQNGGKEKKPTLDIDGQVVTAPSNSQLDEVLREAKILT